MKFKVGDIVVIDGGCDSVEEFVELFLGNELKIRGRCFTPEERIYRMFKIIGVVVGVRSNNRLYDLEVTVPDVYYPPRSGTDVYFESEVRHATDSEKFLYYVNGPMALVDE